MDNSIFIETMASLTWRQIELLAHDKAMVLLSCEPFEEHGPSMPISVDVYFGYVVTRRIKALLEEKGHHVVIAPPVCGGLCMPTGAFPGTFTLRKETLKALIYDILACLTRWGFKHVFITSMHGCPSHRNAIAEATAEAREGNGVRARYIMPYRRAKYSGYIGREDYLLIQPEEQDREWDYYIQMQDGHAGSLESSFLMRYYPEMLDLESNRQLKPTEFSAQDVQKWRSGWSESREAIPDGYYGNPALLEPERAEAMVESEARSHANLIDSYLKGEYTPPRFGK